MSFIRHVVVDCLINRMDYPRLIGCQLPGSLYGISTEAFEFQDASPEAQALRWLGRHGLVPLEVNTSGEARWYPTGGGNEDHFKDEPWCLLPEQIYFALEFPKVEGMDPYPWFYPYRSAIEAAIHVIADMIRRGESIAVG